MMMIVETCSTVIHHVETHSAVSLGRALCEAKAVMTGARSGSANSADCKTLKSCPSCCWITDIIGSVAGRCDSASAFLCFPRSVLHLEIKLL